MHDTITLYFDDDDEQRYYQFNTSTLSPNGLYPANFGLPSGWVNTNPTPNEIISGNYIINDISSYTRV